MTVSTRSVPGRIFMSYRHEETAFPAAWLFDRLVGHFGRDRVFKDVDSIELGDDFVEVITAAVGSCDVLLALIGGRWLTTTGEDGQRRLDNPGDFIRLEIEAALTRNVRVIPILVDGARMPRAEDLPPSLTKLARRQALELSPSRFDADTQRLLGVLDRSIAEAEKQGRRDESHAAAEATEPTRRRQAELRALYVTAGAELRVGHFDTTIGLLDDLLILDPDYADAAALRDTARRGQQLVNGYTLATEAENSGDWLVAVRGYEEVLRIDPQYRDAAARKEACRVRQQVADLQAELRQHAGAGQWQAVLEVDTELTRLDASSSDPDGLATRAREALAAQQRAADLEQRYDQARAAEDRDDWLVAVRGYEEVLRIDPQYRDAAARRNTCQFQLWL